jgi:hypothetical protein
MRVRLTTDRAVEGIGIQNQGDVVDLDDKEAHRLLAFGQAEPVEIETASLAVPETAARRPKRR